MAHPGAPRWAIGIDTGGTFVDVVACASDGRLLSLKHPREAGQLAAPMLAGIGRMLAEHGIAPASVVRLVHGSTIVTNLLLEHDAPPIGLLTTRGMRDVLALARQHRRDLYAQHVPPPTPEAALFPARLRREIAGRIDAEGHEVEPINDGEVLEAAAALVAAGVQSIAVCMLFSHLAPHHERHVRDLLARAHPGLHVSISSEVDAKPREFERFLGTALDAYAKPTVAGYLRELSDALVARGLPEPFLMRSEGGISPWRDVVRRPISLAMSGPCAALLGVGASLAHDGQDRTVIAIAIDVGGTSTDIGLLEAGQPMFAESMQCGALSVRLRCADVESLSVGGGSIAQVSSGGGLRLGPRSQGAWPGPAAYALGGTRATLTDALVVLGRLPEQLAGGVRLDSAAALGALAREVAMPMDMPVPQAAAAIVEAAASTMAEALKMRAFERGLDPAACLLVAAGGGGAQHAAEVAELAGIAQVRVLPHASVVAALGLLGALPSQAREQACALPLDAAGLAQLQAMRSALTPDRPYDTVRWSLELCHTGQESAIEIAWNPSADDAAGLRDLFDRRHRRLRGIAMPGRPVQVRLLRAVFEQALPDPGVKAVASRGPYRSAWQDIPAEGVGPRALFAALTTVWVPPGWRWTVRDDDALDLHCMTEPAHG